jgi:hypothetical protein
MAESESAASFLRMFSGSTKLYEAFGDAAAARRDRRLREDVLPR